MRSRSAPTIDLRVADGARATVAADDFFVGPWTRPPKRRRAAVAVRFPVWGAERGFAHRGVRPTHGDFAIAGAACAVELSPDGSGDRGRAMRLLGMAAGRSGPGPPSRPWGGASATDRDPAEIGDLAVAGTSNRPTTSTLSARYRRGSAPP